ncbi:hypothetical protein LTR17_012981 [Elasticomyces elasticus]|nr:hypothetical protein LTR17_012981 [Elasticomyces elasticus]
MATMKLGAEASLIPTPSKTIVLAEDGDVVLVIQKMQRIRVSSTVLALASPVFKQMLGPHFLEGQAPRSAEQPTEIQLPEDGTWEMKVLLAWMHHHDIDIDMSRCNCDAVYVTRIAAHIDKYACSSALRLTAEAVLNRRLENINSLYKTSAIFRHVAWTAKAAYLLGAGDLFTRCTRRLILDGIGPYSDIPSLAADVDLANREILPVTVLLAMEEQRSRVRSLLLYEVSMISEGCVSRNCTAVATSSTFPQSMAETQDTLRWPPTWGDTSLSRVLRDLEGKDVEFEQKLSCRHQPIQRIAQSAFSYIRMRIEEEVYGVCFDCARQDKMQSTCEHTKELKNKAGRVWNL